LPRRFAQAWGDKVSEKLKADYERDPKEFLQSVSDDVLISGLFADFYNNSPYVITAEVSYRIGLDRKIETNVSLLPPQVGPIALTDSPMLGRYSIANELFNGQTVRGYQWRRDMTARMPKGDDPVAFMTIDAIRYSIENQESEQNVGVMVKPIGGKIDAVVWKRVGGITWIHRKPNCPAN
jgi:hypothetical protein